MYLHKCSICDKLTVDTHHIKEQNTADSDKMIGHIKRDQESNLVGLCVKSVIMKYIMGILI